MKLYFLRHATAQDIAWSDAARELTATGQEEARRTGRALASLGALPGHVFSSPLIRARQTAEIVAGELGVTSSVELLDKLKNSASTATLLRVLATRFLSGDVLLVGHMPSLAEHAAALIGESDTDSLSLDRAGVVCVEAASLRSGAGRLVWRRSHSQLQSMP